VDYLLPNWTCDPTLDPALGDGCDTARLDFITQVKTGAQTLLGLPASALDSDPRVVDLVLAANALDNGGRYHNWSCVQVATPSSNPVPLPPNTDPHAGKCRYTLRARRLITSPDDVRLVWFDNIKDYTNPALSFFFFIVGWGPGSAKDTAAANFCMSQKSPALSAFGSYFNRPFTVVQSTPFSCGN